MVRVATFMEQAHTNRVLETESHISRHVIRASGPAKN